MNIQAHTLAALIIIQAPTDLVTQAKCDHWPENFSYFAYSGKDLGGASIMQRYNLYLYKDQRCSLDQQGYQISETLNCEYSSRSNNIDVRFASYEDGSDANEYGVKEFRQGELLLTITCSGQIFRTHWGTLRPEAAKTNEGNYFLPGPPVPTSP